MRVSKDLIQLASLKANEVQVQRSLFKSFDKTEDGSLDKKEFLELMKSFGMDGQGLFDQITKGKPPKISFRDFYQNFPKVMSQLFQQADENKDGKLDEKEIRVFAAKFKLDPEKLMAILDPKKKGSVSLDDFAKNFYKVIANPAELSTLKGPKGEPRVHKQLSTSVQAAILRQQARASLTNVLDGLLSKKDGLDRYW